MMAGQLVAELPDRLEERQALDITDRAPDLAQDEIEALIAFPDEILDRVGDVGNHLNGGAEIVAAPLLGEDVLIDAAGGDVVVPGRWPAGEVLVMAEVEVGLRAVIGDENLAVLVGRHRPGIDIEIGVELAQPYLEAARLQQRAAPHATSMRSAHIEKSSRFYWYMPWSLDVSSQFTIRQLHSFPSEGAGHPAPCVCPIATAAPAAPVEGWPAAAPAGAAYRAGPRPARPACRASAGPGRRGSG